MDRVTSPQPVAPDGLYWGRRTKLPAGERATKIASDLIHGSLDFLAFLSPPTDYSGGDGLKPAGQPRAKETAS